MPGKPVAKARPRVTRNGTYTPANTRNWEHHVGWTLREQLTFLSFQEGVKLPMPFEGRVIVDLRFNFDKPKSTPKKVVHKLKKPDWENLAKSICDVIQEGGKQGQGVGIIWDDALITDCIVRKRFSDDQHPEGVEIELTCWA